MAHLPHLPQAQKQTSSKTGCYTSRSSLTNYYNLVELEGLLRAWSGQLATAVMLCWYVLGEYYPTGDKRHRLAGV